MLFAAGVPLEHYICFNMCAIRALVFPSLSVKRETWARIFFRFLFFAFAFAFRRTLRTMALHRVSSECRRVKP